MITIPTECPSCNTSLKLVKDILYCLNDHCPAKWDKKVEGFAKHLKIKGLGPSTIQKLQIQDFHDLYSLSREEISDCLNSEKIADKLYLRSTEVYRIWVGGTFTSIWNTTCR